MNLAAYRIFLRICQKDVYDLKKNDKPATQHHQDSISIMTNIWIREANRLRATMIEMITL